MGTFLARRALGLIPLLLGISVVSYAMMALAPGGSASVFLGSARPMSPEDIAAIRHNLGLDKPWYEQFFYSFYNIVAHHDFGYSFIDGRPVMAKIVASMPATFE